MEIYQPADSFKQIDPHPPLLEDAASASTELWLVQLPVNELGPKDLMDKQWTMHTADLDNKLGHFYSSRGEVYNVVKENVESRKLFAILPDSTDYSVRRITSKICLRRHIELQKGVSVSGHAKSEVTTSETKSRADSTKSQHKRALTDDRQASTVTEASVGNMEGVESETKKKKKKSKAKGSS